MQIEDMLLEVMRTRRKLPIEGQFGPSMLRWIDVACCHYLDPSANWLVS